MLLFISIILHANAFDYHLMNRVELTRISNYGHGDAE